MRTQTLKDGSAIALLMNEIRGAGKPKNVAPVSRPQGEKNLWSNQEHP
jgi:hypothetical protein